MMSNSSSSSPTINNTTIATKKVSALVGDDKIRSDDNSSTTSNNNNVVDGEDDNKRVEDDDAVVVVINVGSSSSNIRWWYVFLITLFSIGLYWRDLDGSWILDDKGTITMNPVVKGDTSWVEVWNRDFWGHDVLQDAKSHKSWRPLCTATFRLNYIWSKKIQRVPKQENVTKDSFEDQLQKEGDISSYWFHVVDRILHGWVTGLSYMVSSYCWVNISSNNSNNNNSGSSSVFGEYGPMLIALFFAAHPIHVESVANSTGRAEVLCALFYFLGFVIYAQTTTARRHSIFVPFVCVMICTFASMLCKEHGITLPIMCIIWDAYLHTQTSLSEGFFLLFQKNNQTNTMTTKESSYSSRRKKVCCYFWVRTALFVLAVGGLALWRWNKNGNSEPDFVCEQNPAACQTNGWTRFINYSYLWSFNFYLLLMPEWACPDWSGDSIPLIKSPYVTDPRFPACMLLWYILSIFIRHTLSTALFFHYQDNNPSNKKWQKSIATSMCWMLLPFLMSSNLLVYVGFVVADRTLYLPSFGYCMLLVQMLDTIYIPMYDLFQNSKTHKNDNKHPTTTTSTNKKDNTPTATSTTPPKKRVLLPISMIVSMILIFYIWKQQVQTKRWSDPVLLWGEGYRMNPNSCITGKEYGMALVNAQRPKDAVPILQSNHQREIHGQWFTHHISDARPNIYKNNNNRSVLETNIIEWSRMAGILQTRFKLVTAMGNSGTCVEARTYIEEGLLWANDILNTVEKEKSQPGADLVGTQSSSRSHSLEEIQHSINKNKAFLLVAKSRCAETAATMGKAALDAIMIVPGDSYVSDHAVRVNEIIAKIIDQKVDPNNVILGWQLNSDGQTARMTFQAKSMTKNH